MSSSGLEQELRNERRIEVWGTWFIGVTLIVSLLAHAAALWSMPVVAKPREKALALEVKMKFEEPPPEPEPVPEPPPPPPPPPPKPKVALPPPPNDDTPPPPPTPGPPPEVVVGATADSVSENGAGPAIQVGNTLYGQGSATAVDSAGVRPLTGPTAPPAPVVTEPSVKSEWTDGVYPEEARENNIEGVVRLQITVSPEGVVTHVVVVKGLGFGLDEEAKRRVRRFRFTPATRDGVSVSMTIPFNFRFALED
jgi:periplasmic protein TonB